MVDKKLAILSNQVYEEIPHNFMGYNVKDMTVDNIEHYVLWNDYETVVVFRGTEIYKSEHKIKFKLFDGKISFLEELLEDKQWSDWIINLDMNTIITAIGEVHEGFYNAVEKIYEDLNKVVKHIGNENISVTGHSLGGSQAIISSLLLKIDNPNYTIKTTVFGCPNIGDEDFIKKAKDLGVEIVRYENGRDIVTKIPPFLNNVGEVIKIDQEDLLPNNRVYKWFIKFKELFNNKIDPIADHMMTEYLKYFKEE